MAGSRATRPSTDHHRSTVKEAAADGKEAVEASEKARPETVLQLPDLYQAKSAILNSLSSIGAQRR